MNKIYIIVLTVFLVACTAPKSPNRQGEYDANLKKAEASVNKNSQVKDNDQLQSKGVIAAENIITVSSRVTGQVVSFNVTLGQHVKKGQVLARLDDTECRDQINRAKAEYEQANYRYQAVLMGLGYKRGDFDSATAAHKTQAATNSGLNVARATYEEALHRLQYFVIKAPISGVIADIESTNFSNVQAGQTLFSIIDDTKLMVDFDVLESEISDYQIGTIVSVTLTSYPGEQYKAHVKEISPQVKANGTVTIHASIPYNKHLLPGMSASVHKK